MTNNSKKSSQKINDLANANLFEYLNVYVVPNGLGKNRINLFKNSLTKYGANLIEDSTDLNLNTTCANTNSNEFDSNIKFLIIIDETSIKTWSDLEKILTSKKKLYSNFKSEIDKNNFQRIRCVNSQWLSECLKKKSLLSTNGYELKPLRKVLSEKKEHNIIKTAQKRHIVQSESENESDEDEFKRPKTSNLTKSDIATLLNKSTDETESEYYSANESLDKTSPVKKTINVNSFACAHSSNEERINHNKFITDKLDELGSIYDKTKDRYRALSYQKASAVLKRHTEAVTTYDQAIKLPGIGKNIAEKIAEIAQTGELRKLNNFNQREDLSAIKMFSDIHGVGPTTAQQFVNQVDLI